VVQEGVLIPLLLLLLLAKFVQDAGRPYLDESLREEEVTRPDVVVMNNAAAFTSWYQVRRLIRARAHASTLTAGAEHAVCAQTMASHVEWAQLFVDYLRNGSVFTPPASVVGREGLQKPMQLLWYSPPFIVSPAHPGTPTVTAQRMVVMDSVMTSALKDLPVTIIDTTTVSRARWEAAYDGLHYLSAGEHGWRGATSTMLFQIVLNTLFPTCRAGVVASPEQT
jgi:hypothetical protein